MEQQEFFQRKVDQDSGLINLKNFNFVLHQISRKNYPSILCVSKFIGMGYVSHHLLINDPICC